MEWPHPEEKGGVLESPKGNHTTVCRHKHPADKMPSMHKAPLEPPSASTEGAATEGLWNLKASLGARYWTSFCYDCYKLNDSDHESKVIRISK